MHNTVLHLQTRVLLGLLDPARLRGEAGQATAEYALVLLGAAAIALLVASWATKTNTVGRLLESVFGHLLGKTRGA